MWLYSKKRYSEAEKVLQRIAKLNGIGPSHIKLSAGGTLSKLETGTKSPKKNSSEIFESKENPGQGGINRSKSKTPIFTYQN